LYNSGDSDIDVSGFYLSDNPAKIEKWAFPSGTIVSANGYLLVFASDKNTVINGELHTNFKFSIGETAFLADTERNVVDSVTIPSIAKDTGFARKPDGGEWTYVTCTPGATNDDAQEIAAEGIVPPSFSYESGFYNDEISVILSQSDGYDIYYTTDFTEPTLASEKYVGAIQVADRSPEPPLTATLAGYTPSVPVNKSTVIRAVAVDEDENFSACVTKTYFIGVDRETLYPDMPIVSITTAPDRLFDSETGIYANPYQRGKAWEREVNITYIDGGGNFGFSQSAGIRVRGDLSRRELQKSFNVYARSEYGAKEFIYPVIPGAKSKATGEKIKDYKGFMLRDGGNNVSTYKYLDSQLHAMNVYNEVAIQDSALCTVFINGEYWGPYYLQEKYDDHYIETNYGVDSDDVVLIKAGTLEEGESTDYTLYSSAMNFAKNADLTNAANYEEFCNKFDVDSLCHYCAIMTSIANNDWPQKNYALWRSRTITDEPYHDGKWRFMVFDADLVYYQASTNMLKTVYNAGWIKQAVENEDFKRRYVTALSDTINLVYSPEQIRDGFWAEHSAFSPYAQAYCARFGKGFSSYQTEAVKTMAWSYFWKSKLEADTSAFFALDNAVDVLFQTNVVGGGTIKVNGISADVSAGPLKCRYFTEYPITIAANPKKGYAFSHWYVTGGTISNMNSTEAIVNLTDDTVITAVFVQQ
jgi:hypothetical protein